MSTPASSKAAKSGSKSSSKATSGSKKKTTDSKEGKPKSKSNGESNSTKKVQIDPKIYNACKKEVNAEIRRLKAEASSQVLVVFDREEDYEERFVAPMSLSQSLAFTDPELSSLDSIIDRIPDCDLMSLLKASGAEKMDENSFTLERWSDLLRISLCFFSYNSMYQLPDSTLSLRELVRTLILAHGAEDPNEPVPEAPVAASTVISATADPSRASADEGDKNAEDAESMAIVEDKVVVKDEMDIDERTDTDANAEAIAVIPSAEERDADQPDEGVEPKDAAMDVDISPAEAALNEALEAARAKRERARADVDLLQLKLAKSLADQLNHIFDADNQAEGATDAPLASSSTKKKTTGVAQQFPLNQLTWPELARMGLLSCLLEDAGRSAEDIQTMLRGGKLPNFKTAKSVARMIRNRLLVRSFRLTASANASNATNATTRSELYAHLMKDSSRSYESMKVDSLLAMSTVRGTCFKSPEPIPQEVIDEAVAAEDGDEDDMEMNAIFASESDVIGRVADLNWDGTLARCCKVFVKVASTAQARPFFWEIDSATYPEYYDLVKQPMTLSNVALKLIRGTYIKEASFEHEVALIFYEDMKKIFMNCITFNTEAITNVAQAHKLLAVLHRHFDAWVWSATRAPDITQCHDVYCLLTHTIIQYKADPSVHCDIKCGRCSGVFSLDALSASSASTDIAAYVIEPTAEQIKQAHDDWFCPFCLRENSELHPSLLGGDYSLDEWGPSGARPWVLNPLYSHAPETSLPAASFALYTDALRILFDSSRSSVVSPINNSTLEGANKAPRDWSIDERVAVLSALCEAMKASTASLEFVAAWWAACERLGQVCSKGSFREADFNEAVERVAGKKGVTFSRLMLDGIEGAELDKQTVIVGRCCICHRSTFEEDCRGEDVLLCDACNAEGHFPCTKLAAVTKKEWHCPACVTRLATRESKMKRSFDSLELFRHLDLEESLLEDAIRVKAGVQSSVRNNDPFKNVECSYCGLTELSLCSPFVVGQSREEHEAHIRLFELATVDNFFPGKSDTKVHFIVGGAKLKPPVFEAPFFPQIRSRKGKSLLEAVGNSSSLAPVIVHESCALQMFRARWERDRHSMRRKRGLIAEKVVDMCGLCCKALGSDASGRTYWKFPTSEYLFICSGASPELENSLKADLRRECELAVEPPPEGGQTSKDARVSWKMVSSKDEIRAIVSLLGSTSTEQLLRQNLITALLDERFNPVDPVKPNESAQLPEGNGVAESKVEVKNNIKAEGGMSANPSESNLQLVSTLETSSAAEDGEAADASRSRASGRPRELSTKAKSSSAPAVVPPTTAVDEDAIMLKLLPDKGVQVPAEFIIKEETICVDSDDYELEDDVSHKEYFEFARKYFAIALVYVGSQKRFRPAKGTMTVTYQIHIDGKINALAYTPLDEAWTDSIYYFSSLVFKRSGNYTVSFLAEGENAVGIEPLIFPIKVRAKSVLYGPVAAMHQLNASKFLETGSRQITLYRRDLLRATEALSNELDAVKSVILTFYAALPFGSLTVTESNLDSQADMVAAFAGSESWSDILDQAWRGAVLSASTPTELMECVLLLEYSINKTWFHALGLKLMGRLPSPHFAIRCCSLASVALRIYSLDRAIFFDKVYVPPRGSRGRGENITLPLIGSSQVRQSATSKPRYKEYEEDDLPEDNDDDNDDVGGGRKRRAAAVAATQSLQQQQKRKRVDSTDDFNPADWMEERRSSRNRSKVISYSERDANDDFEEVPPPVTAPTRAPSRATGRAAAPAVESVNLGYCPVDIEAEMQSLRDQKANIVSLAGSEEVDDGLSPMDAKIFLYGLLNKLNNDVDTFAFWAPVDTKTYKDYKKYVKEPMDLGTIAMRLRDDYYVDNIELFRKVYYVIHEFLNLYQIYVYYV